MRIETVCTGDELLTGLTTDSNSTYFQAQLLEVAGVTVRRNSIVPDQREDIVEVLLAVTERADVALISGGLGPTIDDITADCAAEVAEVTLVEDAKVAEHIRRRFALRGLTATPQNLRSARVPQGAQVFINQEGSAPLFVLQIRHCICFFVPGVPREYRHLVDTHVLPKIRALRGDARFKKLRVLKVMELGESELEARVRHLYAKYPSVNFGYRIHFPENHLKLLSDDERALSQAREECREILGPLVFGEGAETLPEVLGQRLLARRQTLAVAESCTGGLIAEEITSIPGASAWFDSGTVTYSEASKQRWVHVDAETLKNHGAVSEAVAAEMARGVRSAAGTTWGASVTGFAGPDGGTEDNPVGTVYLGIAGPSEQQVRRYVWKFERDRVRHIAAWTLMNWLRLEVERQATA